MERFKVPQEAVAHQCDGHPTVVLRQSPQDGIAIARIPNGTVVNCLGPSACNFVEVAVEVGHRTRHGWVKKQDLQASSTPRDAVEIGHGTRSGWVKKQNLQASSTCRDAVEIGHGTCSGWAQKQDLQASATSRNSGHGMRNGWVKKQNLQTSSAPSDSKKDAFTNFGLTAPPGFFRAPRLWTYPSCDQPKKAATSALVVPEAPELNKAEIDLPLQPDVALQVLSSGPRLQACELPEDFVSRTSRELTRADFTEELGHPDIMLTYLLEVQCICLLSGRWLVEQFDKGVRFFPRRQEMPASAYFPAAAIFRKRIHPLALSYGWIEPDHPDRDSWHMTQVALFLKHWISSKLEDREDVPVFWDFYSLEQLPRDTAENLRFKAALKFMSAIYGHRHTTVLRLNHLPPGVDPMCCRGWPFFEEAVFLATSKLALGGAETFVCTERNLLLSLDDPDKKADDFFCSIKAAGKEPISPSCFRSELQDKRFMLKEDRSEVEKMYHQMFETILKHISVLEFDNVAWDVPRACQLGDALYHYPSVETLSIKGKSFNDECLEHLLRHSNLQERRQVSELQIRDTSVSRLDPLAAVLCANSDLKKLTLKCNCITRVESLRQALAANTGLAVLDLSFNCITNVEPLCQGLVENAGLTDLNLSVNCITHVESLCQSLAFNAGLSALDIWGNKLSHKSKEALRQAWPGRGKLCLDVFEAEA